MRNLLITIYLILQLSSCSIQSYYPHGTQNKQISGTEFYNQVKDSSWEAREQIVFKLITEGYTPHSSRKYLPIKFNYFDSMQGLYLKVKYFVTADYLSIGNNKDFMRIPMTPILAQKIADNFHCFLPTRKIVNDIYENSSIKIAPYPLTEYRDSIMTFFQHNQLIEKERNGKSGLIAGIKKDIVITDKINSQPKTNKVAIYGWHKLDGNPIQPLYTGHVNWYVDYSHGVRLISRTIYIDEKKYDYLDILKSKSLRKILSDEDSANFVRYPDHF